MVVFCMKNISGFARGFGSVLSFRRRSDLQRKRLLEHAREIALKPTREALAQDWATIGEDLLVAIHQADLRGRPEERSCED